MYELDELLEEISAADLLEALDELEMEKDAEEDYFDEDLDDILESISAAEFLEAMDDLEKEAASKKTWTKALKRRLRSGVEAVKGSVRPFAPTKAQRAAVKRLGKRVAPLAAGGAIGALGLGAYSKLKARQKNAVLRKLLKNKKLLAALGGLAAAGAAGGYLYDRYND